MLEVFTIGGGEYIVNVLNAVAAWCGGGGYRSMLQVVFVMGLIYSLFIVAFSLDWRAWFNWFLISTLVYMMLMVPTVTIKVTDRIDPGLAPAAVANVPLGLGVMASFTSQLGDWMTRTAETVFVMPNALALSNNGMIYGARLLEKAQTFQITDAVFRANLDEHLKQCTFYDVLLGFKSMDDLTRTNNLWAAIGPGSVSRAQKWISKTGAGTTESSIIPCNEAYQRMDVQWADAFNKDILPFAKNAYPKLADTVAAQKLRDDLPQVAAAMHGTSSDAYSYLKQVSTIDSFLAARESFSDAGWDAYAAQRADAQTRNTYTSIAQQAMTWVPLLGIVLTVVFYAMFPVLFPLFLFPRTGISTLKGYATGFFYLASWGPLYVILHMFVMSRAASSFHALAPNGPTLLVADGITSVNNDISTVAGFLMMSVPFLAAGMAKGAMSVAGQATSMLAPAQNAAEAAAAERTTGNYSYGNTSFANTTSNMQQSNKWDAAPMHTSGFARSTFVTEDGGLTTNFADGSNSFDTRGAISSLAFTPTRSASFGNEARQALSEGESRVNQVRHAASESWSSTASTANDLLRSAETRTSSSTESGSGTNNSISKMDDVSRALSDSLQNRYGLSQSDADAVSRLSTTTGEANAGLSVLAKRWGIKGDAGVGLRLASIASRTTGHTVTGDQAIGELRDYVSREANSTQARSARDEFMRETSTSGDSNVRSLSEKLGVSLNDSRSVSRDAVNSEEAYNRISRDISNSESRGFSLNQNETQEFVTFAQEELMKPENGIVASTGWTPGMARPRTDEQRQARDIMIEKFMSDRMTRMRENLGLGVPKTLGHALVGPSITTEGSVREWGGHNAVALAGQGPDVHVRRYSGNAALAGEVSDRIGDGSARITNAAFEIGNAVDASRDTVGTLGETVGTRNEQTAVRTMPVVSPLMDNVDRRIAGAGAWIDDHGRLGGSHITAMTAGQKPRLPISGTITSGMGERIDPLTGHLGQHRGIDIAAAAGTVIRAPAAGTVVKRDFQENGAGNYLVLQHAGGLESKYFHMQNGSTLAPGSSVRAGAVLGRVGSTGHSTGPHLHYEVWKDGRAINPLKFVLNE